MAIPTLHVIVKDKNGVTAEGDYTAVTTYNEVGLFDILPFHTNFITLIKTKLILRKGAENKEIKVGTGLLRVQNGMVNIYLGLPETTQTPNQAIKANKISA